MAQAFTQYDPKRVIVTIAGILLQGFADGTFLRIRQMTPAYSSKAGADGLVARIRGHDQRAEVSFTLMGGSSSNDPLSALHNADLESVNGSGVGPLLIQDLNGRTLVEGTYTWITKAPDREFSKDDDAPCEWACETARAIRVDGGR